MKKVIKMKDLDIVKEQKKMEKKIDEAFQRDCLICSQPMDFIGELVWYCKRCDTLTAVSNLISFVNEPSDRKKFIEYE